MLQAFMEQMPEPASAVSDQVPPAAEPLGFEDFFREHQLRLFRALYLVTGNRQEAEEIEQDSFLAVWERWDRVRSMEEPAGYLYRTAMNRFRSRARRAVRVARDAVGIGPGGDEFAAADERDAVARALAQLPTRQRAAVVLTELLGYGSDEAGEILGIKAVTVRVLASQARASMRETLGERS